MTEYRSSVYFSGKSGQPYRFYIYTLSEELPDYGAVYAFIVKSWPNDDFEWSYNSLYFGQTKELATRIANHEKLPEAVKEGCQHIGVMKIEDEEKRTEVERDLIREHLPKLNDITYQKK